jgi:transposase
MHSKIMRAMSEREEAYLLRGKVQLDDVSADSENWTTCQRTVERAVQPRRAELRAARLATVRYETRPGQQLQADFGELWVPIGGERVKVHLCVLTLGYSRRQVVRAYRNEQQANWLLALEEAFHHWGGIPEEVLVDKARVLVTLNNPKDRGAADQSQVCGLCRPLGVHGQGVSAEPAADQRQGRARRAVRERRRHCRPRL